MPLTVAIVGRPNVGKSTLFNRLIGRRRALVDPTPGVTRDRIEGAARLGDLEFCAIDTAGLEEGAADTLEGRLRRQTEAALEEAGVALMLIDARTGVHPLDEHFARWLRRSGKPVILLANKCESATVEASAAEAWSLGLGAPIPISAEHGTGLADLADALQDHLAGVAPAMAPQEEAEAEPLKLAVVGRPNVGKSSLINRLLRDERLLTGPEPGLTRDAVEIAWQWHDRRIELVDTAGLRRKSRVEPGSLERLSSRASLAALREAHVVLLLVDARTPLERQDLVIAERAIDAGRALVVAANKWDLVDEPRAMRARIDALIDDRLHRVRGLPWLPVSVLTGENVARLLPMIVQTFDRWAHRVPTSALNRWLERVVAAHPPPLAKGRRVRIRYVTQVSSRPPTFVLFVSQAGALPESYLRYLANDLRATFDLEGVPLRLQPRTGKNPYV